jgi:hypothetical protein
MHKKQLILAILMASAQSASAATTWNYDFSGDLSAHFTQFMDTPDPSTSLQADDQLKFHTKGQVSTEINPGTGLSVILDTNEIYIHNVFKPRFDQSWSAEVVARVPKSLDPTLPNTPHGENWYTKVDLATVFNKSDGTFYTFNTGVGIDSWDQNGVNRGYGAEYGITPPEGEYTEYLDGQGNRPHTDESGVVRLQFDGISKVLSAHNAYGTLLSIDLNAQGITNWGMNDNDTFMVGVGSTIKGWAIPENMPLSLDNFSATLYSSPQGSVTHTFLGNYVEGEFSFDFGAHDADGIAQLVAQGTFNQPTFMLPGATMQLFEVAYSGDFDGPLELAFNYDPSLLPEGFDEDNLRIYHWTGTEWENLGGVVDTANNTITVTTNSLSPFAVAAVPEPETYALMLAGLGLVGVAARRRRG